MYCCHFVSEAGFVAEKIEGVPVQGKITPRIRRRDSKAIRPVRLKRDICLWEEEDCRGDSGSGSESGL